MSSVAVAFAFLGNGGTATGLGVVFTANIAPMIAFLLVGGALADRLGRRRIMLAADLVRCSAQSILAAMLWAGHPSLWLFVATAFVVGTGNAFFSPALSGLPVQLAPPEQLGDANALLGAAQPTAQVAGPALAGILIALTAPALVIAVDAATYAVSALALSRLRLANNAQPAVPRKPELFRDLAAGWAEFTAHPWLWPQTVQFALFNLVTWGPYLVLGPVLADQYLGGARSWGMILACYGVGAVLGSLLALGRRPRRPLLVVTLTTFGFALPPLALALRLPLPAVASAALSAGLAVSLGGAFAATVEQRLISPEALSRVGAFNMVGAYAFGPIAFIAAGPAAATFGPRPVLAFGAAWSAALTLAVLAVPAIRHQPWPVSAPSPPSTSHARREKMNVASKPEVRPGCGWTRWRPGPGSRVRWCSRRRGRLARCARGSRRRASS
jgi:MFS family permease